MNRITLYRGYKLWLFDGYYDIHTHDSDTTAISEGYATLAEAKREVDGWVNFDKFMRVFGGI